MYHDGAHSVCQAAVLDVIVLAELAADGMRWCQAPFRVDHGESMMR